MLKYVKNYSQLTYHLANWELNTYFNSVFDNSELSHIV